MLQLRVAVELEPIDGTDARAWRVPERALVIHQLTDGDTPIEGHEWTWERPRINWRGSGDPPKRPRAFVELAGGATSNERRFKLPSLVGLAALIGALGGVVVQFLQSKDDQREIERLEQQVATLEEQKGALEADGKRLADKILASTMCGGPGLSLEGQIDDCLQMLAYRIQVDRDIQALDKRMDSP
jgi:hypothetical protein